MRLLSTYLIFALAIVVNLGGGVTAQDETKVDQVAEEARNKAVTIVDSPKYLTKQPSPPETIPDATHRPQSRPPSKPPLYPDKPFTNHSKQNFFADIPRPYFGQFGYPRPYHKPLIKYPNSIYQFPRVIPLLPGNHKNFYVKSRPLQFVASTFQPTVTKTNAPQFSIPVQTITGTRADTVRPPKLATKKPKINSTTTTTTTTTTTEVTTTARLLRTKRIWPKKVPKQNVTKNATSAVNGTKIVIENYNAYANEVDIDTSASHHSKVRYISRNSTTTQATKREYRPVTRAPKRKTTTTSSPLLGPNFESIEPNDWVPIVPSHFPKTQKNTQNQTPKSSRSKRDVEEQTLSKRSDFYQDNEPPLATEKEMMYMQSFGLVPVPTDQTVAMDRKRTVIFKPKRNPYVHQYNSYSTSPLNTPYVYGDLHPEESHQKPRYVTKIKHHHHHHHHKYVKTVNKPIKVPYKVEVPKPYPVPVEKKVAVPVEKIKFVEKAVPYPVPVEKKVPYPIGIKVPHPVPVKVVEKEYVPKPYPIVHHVPVVKHVQVKVPVPQPYPVEKRVPYPVEVKVPVPVDRPVPVPVQVEKQVPYPVQVKVFVPQPYPVETKVPYPVRVREPVEVIKHVRIPYPVEVKVPYPVEKRVPYPVEVERKVPVPVEVLVPQRVEVEKRVPVYIPKPYPVEKKVPYPVRVPYPVKVPVKVPYEVPVYFHSPYQVVDYEDVSVSANPLSSTVQHTVTVHGNQAFTSGFQSRSDDADATTQAYNGFQSRSDDADATTQAYTGFQSRSDNTQSLAPSDVTTASPAPTTTSS